MDPYPMDFSGNLNVNKCFYYYLQPTFNFSKQKTSYTTIYHSPGHIIVNNPATQTNIELKRIEPNEVRRTLGVILAPNGDASK